MKLVCLMHIELLHVFPVVLCFCRCVVVTGFDRFSLTSLKPNEIKLFSTAKEPFNFFSFL